MQRELLLFASVCFLIGSLDDAAFDVAWIAHRARRRLNGRNRNRTTSDRLPVPSGDRPFAVFVAAWDEEPVVARTLERCLSVWSDTPFRLFVGCYPNDPATVTAVERLAAQDDRVRLVMVPHAGPTSKADCLNHLWREMVADEMEAGRRYRAVVLQDAEDVVHPHALRVFAHLIDRAPLVQLPVIPRRTVGARWVAGHYGDEFAEMHAKQMVLREAFGVALPSAGVGCAFDRDALDPNGGERAPFNPDSLTEDYELGMALTGGEPNAARGGIFARIRDAEGQLVGTQEFFPDTLSDAVRQKSRWMAGIALTGWDRLGWRGGLLENWMRLRDRKATFAAFILALAYLAIVLTGLLAVAQLAGGYRMEPLSPALVALLWVNLGFLVWRLAMKAGFVFGLYGLREAIWSVPRTVVANIISILAARRALGLYLRTLRGRAALWDKTRHFHPSSDEILGLRELSATRPERMLARDES